MLLDRRNISKDRNSNGSNLSSRSTSNHSSRPTSNRSSSRISKRQDMLRLLSSNISSLVSSRTNKRHSRSRTISQHNNPINNPSNSIDLLQCNKATASRQRLRKPHLLKFKAKAEDNAAVVLEGPDHLAHRDRTATLVKMVRLDKTVNQAEMQAVDRCQSLKISALIVPQLSLDHPEMRVHQDHLASLANLESRLRVMVPVHQDHLVHPAHLDRMANQEDPASPADQDKSSNRLHNPDRLAQPDLQANLEDLGNPGVKAAHNPDHPVHLEMLANLEALETLAALDGLAKTENPAEKGLVIIVHHQEQLPAFKTG